MLVWPRLSLSSDRLNIFPIGKITGSANVDVHFIAGKDEMKGIVFNLLEEVIIRRHGDAAWDSLLDATGLAGSYTSLGSYPDEEIERLVAAGSQALGTSPTELLRWFGREAMPLLAGHYPMFFK